jgi:peptide/nickel transport system substrate-binding protein
MSDKPLRNPLTTTMTRRRSLQLLGAAGAGAVLPGVRSARAGGRSAPAPSFRFQNQPVPGGSVTVVTEADWVDLDPHTNGLFAGMQAWEYIYESLTQFDAEMNPVPALAESWETPDPLTYIFHLRAGVTWHNGTPFTSADVKYSLDRVLNPDSGAANRSNIAAISAVEAVDEMTVKITLSTPKVFFLETLANLLGTAIIPNGAAENSDLKTQPVGTGPFTVAELQSGDFIRFAKNPTYWGGPLPYLDELVLKLMVEEDTRVAWIRGGQADYIDLYPEAAERLQGEDGITVIEHPKVYMLRVTYNTASGPLADARVRKALEMSLDRFDMIDKARFGGASLTGYIPSGFGDWALTEDQLPAYFTTPDLEGAKALLAEAGYADGFKMTIRGSRQEHIAIAVVAQQNWKEIGVDAEVMQMEYGTYIADWNAKNFDALVIGQTFNPDPLNYLWPLFHSKGGANKPGFTNARVDELLDKAAAITDREELKQALVDAQMAIWEEGTPQSYVYNAFNYEGLRNRVQGYVPLYSARRTAMVQSWIAE